MNPRAPRSVHLSFSGAEARIRRDGYSGSGWVLEIGGIEQSHVDLADQTVVRHEYLRRIANVVDACADAGAPLRVCHLGAGALTLVRYVQATRPGSPQVVVEIERELPSLVTGALPLPEGTDLEVRVGDAAELLAEIGERSDVLVVDVFSGEDTPAHLTRTAFFREALGHLSSRGVMLVNVGDDAGLRFFAAQASALDGATESTGASGVWTLADAHVVESLGAGNLVLAAGPGLSGGDPEARRAAWAAAGPHPAAVLDPAETGALIERVRG